MLRKNDTVEIDITDLAQDGNGVGRADGTVVFVPAAAPGDRIRAKIVKASPRLCYGIIDGLLSPSPDRCDAGCPAFPQCGGCSLRHITYEAECRLKQHWVQENMRRIGKIDVQCMPILPSPQEKHYRNKAIYPIQMQSGTVRIGFYAKRSHRIAGVRDCELHPQVFSRAVEALHDWITANGVSVYDEKTHRGLLRALFLRWGEATGSLMAAVVANGDKLPACDDLIARLRGAVPELTSLILNTNRDATNVLLGLTCRTLWGSDTVEDVLCGLRFELSPLSFYQVNRAGAEQLYGVAAEFADLQDGETLVDLYCGAGTIGLSMMRPGVHLTGVEIVPAAVENARKNAERNGIQNARFICGDASRAAAVLAGEGLTPDVIVVDPPRKGLTPELIATVAEMSPRRVVYVSCNSATLARDCAIFAEQGYNVTRIQPVDMFPRTGHTECVVKLERR